MLGPLDTLGPVQIGFIVVVVSVLFVVGWNTWFKK